MTILVYASNRTNKPVGRIVKKKIDGKEQIVLEKSLRTRHMLRNPPAICYDLSIIEQAHAYGVTVLLTRNTESGFNYSISFSRFCEKSFKVNRGYGAQLGCELKFWDSSGHSFNFDVAQRGTETTRHIFNQEPTITQLSFSDMPKESPITDFRVWVSNPELVRIASLIS